jgi:hypothetical protein
MENPFEIILEKLASIENRLIDIEVKLGVRKNIIKKKKPLITDKESRDYLLKTVFKVKLNN